MRSSATPMSAIRSAGVSAGGILVAVSAVAFSTAGLFTRLSQVDPWTLLFWRGLFAGLTLFACVVWQERGRVAAAFGGIGRAGLVAAGCSTLGTICFIWALRETTVADVTVIYALAPFVAAGIAWAWQGDRPDRVTLTASGVALIGVFVMCDAGMASGQRTGGQLTGALLALTMTVLMAVMMVVIRANRHVSMLPASCLSALTCSVLVLPAAHPLAVTGADFGLLALFGVFQFGGGLLLLTLGSRLIPAARASLLGNLELPLAPLWVWLVFGEVPAAATMVGGGVVCAAVLMDLIADRRPDRPLVTDPRQIG
jgi:drug/metabolite transporter (DMT)-like permease